MAKKIKNPISHVITRVDGEYRCRSDYGVISEDVEERRSIKVTLPATTLNDVSEEAMAQIFAHEGTTEEYVEPE